MQRAWIEQQVPQCGYCQSGMIMAVAACWRSSAPTDEEIDAAITNICRCGTFARVRAAIHARSRRHDRSGVMRKWTRRAFIGAGTVAGGGFLLGVAGFTFAPSRHSSSPAMR